MANVHIANKIELIKMKNILSKSKFLFIFSIITVFLSSCGTRKTDNQSHENIIIENTYSNGSKIVLGNTFTYKPFDNAKPMVIDKKEYVNVIITNNKDKIITKWNNRNITKTITIEKTKLTEKSDHTILWIGIAFVIVLGVLAWFKLPSFKK